MSLLDHLSAKLNAISAQSLTRSLRRADNGTASRQRINGHELLMFCSNDYLGLAAEPAIAEAIAEGARRWGGGSGASPLVSGHSAAHEAVTETLARWYAPYIPQARALGFCTGYMANLAVVTALGDEHTEIFSEQLNHASLIDAARLAKAQVTRYGHADVTALRALLAASTAKVKLIVTDAVFSMDGDLAPLPELLALAEAFDAWLIVDDAHGFGVLGEKGRGSLEHFGLCSERLILVGTLGKAAGLSGAFVAAHATIVDYLLQSARNFIFSTASPPAIEHALLTSFELIDGPVGVARRANLVTLQARLRDGLLALIDQHPRLGWTMTDSATPIQPLIVGGNAEVMALATALEAAGLRVPGIRPPTVAAGTARLRITLCATHTQADVDMLLAALERAAAAQERAA
ncbi:MULTISPECIES: 8-amino-7-oxononanoate synthase [unclassified Roseateles]|uniref:8-amino-7-oxononanoate synthase n=1 Tax=unclassified Roseateles TaxID=2626991 RepID=UPI0006F8BC31|nr:MULTISPECIES: 8-amino-7-oxononanoate synthase [unclassified Roseateles]KQW51329.1 8-amino-7-oxononanoate synthase [Pelomonas sp. Root405]KRA77561.1 8-amino-7-oxononanoate synthase [Pelomonas sp. Root662]